MKIQEETPADIEAIRTINRLAFGHLGSSGEGEVRLVDQLRADDQVVTSLVAVEDGEVVGYILFSPLQAETTGGTIKAAALAPMAVRPEFQGKGIGTALVERGLEVCRERGYTVVVVLGHPGYYPRFGFSTSKGQALQSPYSQYSEAYMALELVPGALEGVSGTVRYPDAFSKLD